MAAGNLTDHEEEDDDLAAARWVLVIDAGLAPEDADAFRAWLAARPERAELIARQAALPALARQAQLEAQLKDAAEHAVRQVQARQLANEQALRTRRRLLIGGAIAAGAAAFGVTAVLMRPPGQAEEASEASYETATAEMRAVDLPDASRLWLDAQTRVTTRMTHARRDVQLAAGRLFVEVAHDRERPFIVSGAQFQARAIGTAFEATLFDGRAGVAVTEGVVRLKTRDGSVIDLAAGQACWITANGGLTRTSAPARSIAAWRERRMVLSDRRLDAALVELSRYFDRPLIVTDGQLAARRVSLSFSIADLGEEGAARIIAAAVGADLADEANGGILLSPSTASDGDQSDTPR